MLTACQNPNGGVSGCRAIGTKRIQAGLMPFNDELRELMNDTIDVKVDVLLCAYCASDFEEAYREDHPKHFVREVPR